MTGLCTCQEGAIFPERCAVTKGCRREAIRTWRGRLDEHPYIRITGAQKPSFWYAPRVGEMVKVLRLAPEGLITREDGGYLNIVDFRDAAWIPHPQRTQKARLERLHSLAVEMVEDLGKVAKELEELKKV